MVVMAYLSKHVVCVQIRWSTLSFMMRQLTQELGALPPSPLTPSLHLRIRPDLVTSASQYFHVRPASETATRMSAWQHLTCSVTSQVSCTTPRRRSCRSCPTPRSPTSCNMTKMAAATSLYRSPMRQRPTACSCCRTLCIWWQQHWSVLPLHHCRNSDEYLQLTARPDTCAGQQCR